MLPIIDGDPKSDRSSLQAPWVTIWVWRKSDDSDYAVCLLHEYIPTGGRLEIF